MTSGSPRSVRSTRRPLTPERGPAGHDHGPAGHDHGPAGHDRGSAGHDHGSAGHDRGSAGHDHGSAGHDHGSAGHEHVHGTRGGHRDGVVNLEQRLLAKNDDRASRNREWLGQRGIAMVNLMSAPGSGKTTLLERTIRDLDGQLQLAVIEGDQETLLDAERVRATGCPVVQINTGAGCHLDADMAARGLHALEPAGGSLVIVENVGNLVCPALFDLGEKSRVVITALTEGADKPLKYPQMFRAADLILINKVDLLPYLDVRIEQFVDNIATVNHDAEVLTVSATHGDGLRAWYERLRSIVAVAGKTSP